MDRREEVQETDREKDTVGARKIYNTCKTMEREGVRVRERERERERGVHENVQERGRKRVYAREYLIEGLSELERERERVRDSSDTIALWTRQIYEGML